MQGRSSTVHGLIRADEFPILNDAEMTGEWVDIAAEQSTLVAGGAVSHIYDLAPGSVIVSLVELSSACWAEN